MTRTVTLTFEDGGTHVYNNVPDNVTPDMIEARASSEFRGRKLVGIDGGKSSAAPDVPKASFGDRVNALQGGLYRGAAGLLGLPMDTVENVYNLAKAGVGSVATAAGRPDLAPELTKGTPLGSEWIANQLQNVGVNTRNPRPDDPASRMLYTGGVIGGGSMLPGAQVKPAVAAATSGAIAGEISDNPLAPAIGAMVPAATSAAVNAARQPAPRTQENVKAFRDAGAEPSVGQATGVPFFQGIENLISKFPGGTGLMKKFFEGQQQKLGAATRTGVSAEDAGRVIERGITGEGGFISRFKATQDTLYNKLDSHIPADRQIDVSNTRAALEKLNADIPGAPALSEWFKNAKIKGIEGALKSDLGGTPPTYRPGVDPETGNLVQRETPGAPPSTTMPYESIKKLRTLVGREMADSTIVSDVPKSKWKALYAALSEDLGVAATQSGPQARAVWERANNYSRSGMDRIETVLDRVIGKGRQPEDIFKVVNPKDINEANKLRAVMRSLLPEERKIVTDAVVNRLGRATPGRQDEFGEVFSSNTFLTNWNKLSPGAKEQLFSDPGMRKNLESLAKAAATIREGAGIAANPSGTAGSFAAYSIYSSPIVAGATGTLWPVLSAGGAMGAANIGARMLTNKKIVDWLVSAPKPTAQNVGMHLARLSVIYNQSDEETRKELDAYMQSVGGQ